MDESERDSMTVRLEQDEYELLIRAREAMYGDNAEDVDLSHTIALLSLEELRHSEKREEEEAMLIEEENALPADRNQETPR